MADSNHNRRADPVEFNDRDPFAELARIMGHDPRRPEEDVSSSEPTDSGDFGIDLERELLGELDFAEFDDTDDNQPAVYSADDWRADIEAQPEFSAPAHVEPEIEVDHSVEDFAASIMDTFEADEAANHPPVEAAQEPIQSAPSTMRSVEMDDAPLDDLLERELAGWDRPDADVGYDAPHAAQDMSEEPLWNEPSDAHASHFPDTAVDIRFASAEAGDLDFDYASEPGSAELEPLAMELPLEEVDAPQRSLEDELNALLAAGDEAIEAERAALPLKEDFDFADEPARPAVAEPVSYAESAAPESQDSWRPGVSTFGRANLVASPTAVTKAAFADAPSVPVAEATFEPVQFDDAPGWDQPEEFVDGDMDQPQPVAFDAISTDPNEDDVFSSIFAEALANEGDSQSAAASVVEMDEVLSHFAVAVPAAEPPVQAAAPAWQPPRETARTAAPEIETIEVDEAAFAVSDDLDIPDVDYGSPQPATPAFDDFDADFADAFDDAAQRADFGAQPVAAASTWSNGAHYSAQPEAHAHHPVTESVEAYALGEGEWQAGEPAPAALSDDFAFDDDFDKALASAVEDGEYVEKPSPSRRGLLVAAAVAGVAVFGGLGLLGMSMFGGGSDTPAVVRADTDPMKVRPENPGGAVVPNQNSEAHNRVSAGASTAAPAQQELITTAEEPVDIISEALPSAIQGEDDRTQLAETPVEGTDLGETSVAALPPKSDERIEVAEEAEGVGAPADLLTVTPRRVRTMIVRPDGTMVPREEAEAPEETVVAAAPLAAPALGPVAGQVAEQAPPVEAQEDAGPTVDTPPTVGVVPSQRAEPQPAPPAPVAAAAAPPVQQTVAQTPPATPVSAPAAAAPVAAGTSEWSMQIASQPTAESAQATYQDLARRYSSVLEGRGVNIVKADIAGKGTYFRVRIPSASRDEAINLCTRYKSAGGSCFVSR